MGLCSSKATTLTTGVTPFSPPAVNANRQELREATNTVKDRYMDQGNGASMTKSNDEKRRHKGESADVDNIKQPLDKVKSEVEDARRHSPDNVTVEFAIHEVPQKRSYRADDIPISSTYHRVHSVEVAEQEKRWQRECRLEAEQREREVREYKAALPIA